MSSRRREKLLKRQRREEKRRASRRSGSGGAAHLASELASGPFDRVAELHDRVAWLLPTIRSGAVEGDEVLRGLVMFELAVAEGLPPSELGEAHIGEERLVQQTGTMLAALGCLATNPPGEPGREDARWALAQLGVTLMDLGFDAAGRMDDPDRAVATLRRSVGPVIERVWRPVLAASGSPR